MAEDHLSSRKRHLDDDSPSPAPPSAPASYNSVPPPLDEIQLAKQRVQAIAARLMSGADPKRSRFDSADSGGGGSERDFSSAGLGQKSYNHSYSSQAGAAPYTSFSNSMTSKTIDIPNGRVGVIIGKGGETIKNLQHQSGAKIQVTRDMDADPHSQRRTVELTGTAEQISRAEQLISDVLAEADAGGSDIITGLKTNTRPPHDGADQFQMKVANNKVGLIIGKGGENIKNLQAKSGARIQIIPLHLPPGDTSIERSIFIDGTPEQIEVAKQLLNEVISENRPRNPASAGAYSQQGYRPPAGWTPPGQPPVQQPGYGYMQPGTYPGAPPQYGIPQPSYGNYGYPAAGGYQAGWDQSSAQSQPPAPGTGYDYYKQQPSQQPDQSVTDSSAPADATGYNYGQPLPYATQGAYSDVNYSQQYNGQQAYGQENYAAYQGYPQPPQGGYDQQAYAAASGYSATNLSKDGSTLSYSSSGITDQVAPAAGGAGQPSSVASSNYAAHGSEISGYGNQAAPPAYGSQSTQYTQASYLQPHDTHKSSSSHVQAISRAPSEISYVQPPPAGSNAKQQSPYVSASPAKNPGNGQQLQYDDGSYGGAAYYQSHAGSGAGGPPKDQGSSAE